MSRSAYRLALVLLVTSGLLSCGGGGGGGSGPSRTLAKATPSGDAKSDTVGHKLADSLRVVVTQDGAPVSGVAVAWNILTGAGSVAPASSQTASDGVASTSWTLGAVSGAQKVRATLSGAAGSPQTFTATALADVPTSIARTATSSGNNQTGFVSRQLPSPLRAQVVDQYGNGVPAVKVGWEVTAGDATVSDDTTLTDGTGVASVIVTLGPASGSSSILAGVTGIVPKALFAVTAAPLPTTAAVSVGSNFFRSGRNGTQNPAVDTIAVNGTVTWTWVGGNHSVHSTGAPSFPSSATSSMNGHIYAFQFLNAGVYTYNCSVHGNAMTGRIVVLSP